MTRFLALTLLAAGGVLSLPAAEIFPRNSQWSYHKGQSEASNPVAAWRQPGFNDSSWATGPTPIGYNDGAVTVLEDMRNNYTSVFLRKEFNISDPNAFSQLELEVLSDDGMIAWINGQEVGRFNMPAGEVPYSATSLGPLPEPIPYERYTISNPGAVLVPGENVVAIHGFNTSLSGSSDFIINASLMGIMDESPPIVQTLIPADRALVRTLNFIEVIFNEGVSGVDASDLLVNGTPVETVTEVAPDQYIFEFPEPATGTVDLAWAENHGIQDLSPVANPFAGGSWSYTFDPEAPLPGVIISEFMADNEDTLNDEDGDESDWIELFNAGTEVADLDGWFLTDDANELSKWRIPNVSIAPNSYLVIFASEKDRTNPAAKLHTNFRLGNNGEFLALVGPLTNLVSAFSPAYPPQQQDVSYGRERANPSLEGYFPIPTPGAANTAGGPGFAPDVIFSHGSQTFRSAFDLTLSTRSPNAVIRYELGTSIPTELSPIYSAPIRITGTTQVRARAFEPGLLPGQPRSENFIQLANNNPIVNFTSDLPIVILHNNGAGTVSASVDQFVMMQVFEPKNGVASPINAPDFAMRGRFKRRGSSTEGLEKVSLAVEAWDEYGDDKDLSLLGLPEESDWVFYAPNFFEPVMIHNPFMYQLSRDIGRYASRTRFAEVYLNTSGGAVSSSQYWGIYVIEEKIKRDDDRVDIHNLQPEHLNPPEVTGGYLLKIDRSDPGDSPFSAAGQSINYVDPKGEEIRSAARDPQEQYIRNYFNEFGNVLNGANYSDPVNGYAKYIDVPAAIDHHLLNVLAFNVDALRLSTYFYKEREGKIVFGPIWDFDRALGSTDGRDSNPFVWRAEWGDRGTDFFNYPWWGRMFSDLEFWQRYVDRYQELRRDQFSLASLHGLVDELTGQLNAARPREYDRWRWGSSSYNSEVQHMKNWIADRIQFMDSQFLAAPSANREPGMVSRGTQVTLTAPEGGTIYYTLNGTDPRARGGGIAPGALTYSGPITVDMNVRIFARARNLSHSNITGPDNPPRTTPWSGAAIATYAIEIPALAITEIMYHPAPRSPLILTNQDLEFIEVKNIGSTPINLGGAEFIDGIEFVFPSEVLDAGERILVVKNRAAFEVEYGTASHRIAGEFSGSLDNAGEMIALNGPLMVPVVSFEYSPTWYPLTDGAGFSLVLKDENTPYASYGLASSWRASSIDRGSPGAADSIPVSVVPVLVNELIPLPTAPSLDTVELFNANAAEVDLSGWYLTDSFTAPRKHRFAQGTILGPGEYLVINESIFNTGANAYAFSGNGEGVYLFSANAAGDLTGYYHGFEYGAAFRDMAFGRHESSDAQEHFVRQAAPSLESPNHPPAHGPVIISEIMYHPPMAGSEDNTMDEYIELQNVSPSSVDLFAETAPASTWRLRGGSDFELPQDATIPAGGFLLLVNFDPSTNAATTAAFRSRYGLAESVPLHGPYRGKLSNTGERLSLQQPFTEDGVAVNYVIIDELSYSVATPWPGGAGGTGDSLQRLPATFANDPASWKVAEPTAALPTDVPNDPDPDGDGLPSEWEIAHGLDPNSPAGDDGASGDPDGDGQTNLEEFVSGTDPQNPSSYLGLSITASSPDSRVLAFEAAAGKSYSILYRSDAESGGWQKLADVPAEPETADVEIPDDSTDTTRFYLLVTPQQP